MKARQSLEPHEAWRRELRETPECVAIERMGEALTSQERDHLSNCARCEAEMALWEEFREATPSADEGGAVQWVAAEVARRHAGHPAPAPQPRAWLRWFSEWRPQALAAATLAAALIMVVYVVQDREPPVGVPTLERDAYRSERIEVVSPTGDLPTPPAVFNWMAVPGAESYDVEVFEVDRTILWRASAREPRIDLAPAVVAQFVPGKTILWEVTARGRDATGLAQSGVQRFRVAVRPR